MNKYDTVFKRGIPPSLYHIQQRLKKKKRYLKALDTLLDGVKNTCLSNGSTILIGCDKHEPELWVYGIKTAEEVNDTDYFFRV